jgi:hypothetical protein
MHPHYGLSAGPSPGHLRLFPAQRRFSSEAQTLCHDQRVAAPSELTGPRVRLVSCAPEHHARLREIYLEPDVRRWWQDPADDFPASMNRSINYAVMLDERVIGFAQWYSEDETIIRFAGLDLFLDPAAGFRPVGVLREYLRDRFGVWKEPAARPASQGVRPRLAGAAVRVLALLVVARSGSGPRND